MVDNVHETVLDSLGTRIAAGDPAPGASFTLADLEAEYDASRTTAREAVKVLESIRMVSSRRRIGITVRPREEWDALDEHLIRWNLAGPFRQHQFEALLELRVAVEPLAARLTAIRATDAQRAELLRLAEGRDVGGFALVTGAARDAPGVTVVAPGDPVLHEHGVAIPIVGEQARGAEPPPVSVAVGRGDPCVTRIAQVAHGAPSGALRCVSGRAPIPPYPAMTSPHTVRRCERA